MTLHYHFKKNKKVFVILKNGTSFVDRWLPHDGKCFCFKSGRRIRGEKIRAITFANPALITEKQREL